MIDLEPLVETEDGELVKDLLARHIRYTQSPVAARLLVDWKRSQAKFVKVIPQDFKRVMAAIKKAQETGMSADEAVMASAHNLDLGKGTGFLRTKLVNQPNRPVAE